MLILRCRLLLIATEMVMLGPSKHDWIFELQRYIVKVFSDFPARPTERADFFVQIYIACMYAYIFRYALLCKRYDRESIQKFFDETYPDYVKFFKNSTALILTVRHDYDHNPIIDQTIIWIKWKFLCYSLDEVANCKDLVLDMLAFEDGRNK